MPQTHKENTKRPTPVHRTSTKGNSDELGARAKVRAQKIKILAKENPKREGSASYKRWEYYKNGMTVGEYLEKGGTMADIRYDEGAEFIKLQ